MPQPVFEELLDEQLMDAQPGPVRGWTSGPSAPSGTASAYGFFFVAPALTAVPLPAYRAVLQPRAGIGVQVAEARNASATRTHRTSESPVSHQPSLPGASDRGTARMLSVRERGALMELQALGAGLTPDFTFDELRSAFRALAFEYHPDRHSARSLTERARCSQLFARARDAYHVLLDVSRRMH
jgi:hypothetical protein